MLRRTLVLSALAAAAAPAFAQTTATAPAQPELEPYTASNALESMFIAAYGNAALRPAFRRQFLESQILVVAASNAPDATPLLRPLRGEDRAGLVFTSAALLNARMGPATPRLTMTGRAALERLREEHVAINYGYAPMLMLDPPGIAGFLQVPAAPDSAGPTQ